jgi:hypothetical protein
MGNDERPGVAENPVSETIFKKRVSDTLQIDNSQ